VPIAPAVRVTNRSGAPVSGVSVTFAIGTGNGVVTGGSQSTGGDGVATVGGWTLGAVGSNTLVATVTGATGGSPVTFTATGEEILIRPGRDTTMSGVVTVTRFVVDPGVTITADAGLTIVADSTIRIDGTLRGNCVGLAIKGKQAATITGTVDNACATPNPDAPALLVLAEGGYAVTGATLRSSGDLKVTSDSTLTVPANPSPALSSAAAGAVLAGPPCTMQNSTFTVGPKATGGSAGKTGAAGTDGRHATIACKGDLSFLGGARVFAEEGGDGGAGTDASGINAVATGGAGGRGGNVYLTTPGTMIFTGQNTFAGGKGGNGGPATANGIPLAGAVAAGADALGGPGGAGGVTSISGATQYVFNDPTTLGLGDGGAGGKGKAVGADGLPNQTPAQTGGPATARGGPGGSVSMTPLPAPQLVNPQNVQVGGGKAGDGGEAETIGGRGGDGGQQDPNGGTGGAMSARGGRGGDSRFAGTGGLPIGPGGTGGRAVFRGGAGGTGAAFCSLPIGFRPGGNGGTGGSATGGDGLGGSGLGGAAGGVLADNAGMAGLGGMGMLAGITGQGGTDGIVSTGARVNNGQNFFRSFATILDCFRPNLLSKSHGVTRSGGSGPPWPACSPLVNIGNFQIRNWSTEVVTVQTIWNGPPSMTLVGGNGQLAPGGFATEMTVTFFWDCTDAASWNSTVTVKGTLGGTTYSFSIPVSMTVN
jgi:hypothetical protein